MRNKKGTVMGTFVIALVLVMQIFSVFPSAVTSNVDIAQTIADGKWIGSDGTTLLSVVDGVVQHGGWGSFSMDQSYNLGDKLEFMFKMQLKEGQTKPASGWFLTIGVLDNAIGKVFWDGAAYQLGYQLSVSDAGKTRLDLLAINAGGQDPYWNLTSDIDIYDGQWHKMTFQTVAATVPNKINAMLSIDDVQMCNQLVENASKDYASIFASGKLSFYLNDSTKDIYDVSIKAAPQVVLELIDYDFTQGLADQSFKFTDGNLAVIEEDTVKAGLTTYFYLDQKIQMNKTISFKGKFTVNPEATLDGGWQVVFNLIDKQIGKVFWDSDAKSVNTQFTPYDDATGGLINAVYKNGSTAVFNEADSDFETTKTLLDGQWHLFSYKVFPLTDGSMQIILLVDGEKFIDKILFVTDVDFSEYFEEGKLSFYSKGNYDIQLMAAPSDTPEISNEVVVTPTPIPSNTPTSAPTSIPTTALTATQAPSGSPSTSDDNTVQLMLIIVIIMSTMILTFKEKKIIKGKNI